MIVVLFDGDQIFVHFTDSAAAGTRLVRHYLQRVVTAHPIRAATQTPVQRLVALLA